MRFRLFSFLALAAISFAGTVFAQRQGASVSDISARIPVKAVAIEANDAVVGALARRAFGAHGDYEVRNTAPTRLRLTRRGDALVNIVVQTGGKEVSTDVSGANLTDATLRACDVALARLQQRPFFAGPIVFVSDVSGKKEIFVGDIFLSKVQQLTRYNTITVTPRWSNDGSEVLFTTYSGGSFTDIYAMNTLSGRRRALVVGVRGTSTGAVSNPRTGQVAFASSVRGNMDLYGADASGRGARPLVATSGVESDPAWSPDGARLALAGGAAGSPAIHIVNADGTGLRRISTGYTYATEPTWNPVFPSKIAFTYQKSGFNLAIVDLNNGITEAVDAPGGNYVQPSWCADGRHLIATRQIGGSSTLVLIDSKSKKVTVLSGRQMNNCSDADYRAVR
ncbi:MAG: hypothetical protein LBV54_01830 [Puniceicoccales bacterium]|jgi:TolB protein|nr:hypothetical protein [Puniceicoccales bacterium]